MTIQKVEVLDGFEVVKCSAGSIRPIALMRRANPVGRGGGGGDVGAAAEGVHLWAPRRGMPFGGRRSMCAGESSVGLRRGRSSLRFFASFPKVLERMRWPGRLARLITATHQQNATAFEVSGSPAPEVQVASGTGQGCPLRWSLLALCLDPYISRLTFHRTFATVRQVAYVDDLAAVVGRLRHELPHLLAALRRWAQLSGLPLNAPQFVFLTLWGGEVSGMREFIIDVIGLHSARVERVARCFGGVSVGTDTRGGQWREIAAMLAARARHGGVFGAACPTNLRLFGIHCRSRSCHRAKVSRRDGALIRAYRTVARRVCAAP